MNLNTLFLENKSEFNENFFKKEKKIKLESLIMLNLHMFAYNFLKLMN